MLSNDGASRLFSASWRVSRFIFVTRSLEGSRPCLGLCHESWSLDLELKRCRGFECSTDMVWWSCHIDGVVQALSFFVPSGKEKISKRWQKYLEYEKNTFHKSWRSFLRNSKKNGKADKFQVFSLILAVENSGLGVLTKSRLDPGVRSFMFSISTRSLLPVTCIFKFTVKSL